MHGMVSGIRYPYIVYWLVRTRTLEGINTRLTVLPVQPPHTHHSLTHSHAACSLLSFQFIYRLVVLGIVCVYGMIIQYEKNVETHYIILPEHEDQEAQPPLGETHGE